MEKQGNTSSHQASNKVKREGISNKTRGSEQQQYLG